MCAENGELQLNQEIANPSQDLGISSVTGADEGHTVFLNVYTINGNIVWYIVADAGTDKERISRCLIMCPKNFPKC